MTTPTDVLHAARQLACRGDHDAALAVLDTLDVESAGPETDLLRAKVLAQRKDFDGALTHWRRVLGRDPENLQARQGIETAERLRRRPGWLVFWRFPAVAAVALLTLLAGGVAGWRGLAAADDVSVDGPQAKQLVEIRQLHSQLEAARAQLATHRERQAAPPDLDIDVPGVSLRQVGSQVALSFEVGLFTQGATLRAGARDLLVELGRQLASDAISIQVVGHTDDLPLRQGTAYRDNEALGLARAVAVIQELRTDSALRAQDLQAATWGAVQAPFPNQQPDQRLRNRTVTILVSRRAD